MIREIILTGRMKRRRDEAGSTVTRGTVPMNLKETETDIINDLEEML